MWRECIENSPHAALGEWGANASRTVPTCSRRECIENSPKKLAMICARPRRRVDRCVCRRTHSVLSALDDGECYVRRRTRGSASYLRWLAIVAVIGACAHVARKVNCIACATGTWSGFIAGASMIVANIRGQLRRDDAQLALRLI